MVDIEQSEDSNIPGPANPSGHGGATGVQTWSMKRIVCHVADRSLEKSQSVHKARYSCKLSLENKPSFCSGSCDEIQARSKLQNKTSLNTLWKTLEAFFSSNFLETHLTLPLNTLETFLICLWNYLETPLKHSFTSLRYHWCYLESPLKVSRNTFQSPLKHS